jgi:hypothetical protein
MIDLSKHIKHLHYIIRLSKCFRDDLKWWLTYLPTWNGVSAFQNDQWCTDDFLKLYRDSSDVAIGAVLKDKWFYEIFQGDKYHYKTMSIAWRELYAVVKAIATWGSLLCNKRILLHCDNLAVVHITNSGTSKEPRLMKLVRALFYLEAQYNVELRVVHIEGVHNAMSDALSRLNIHKFFNLNHNACPTMSLPGTFWYDNCMI